jgi:hypothetical protein
VGTDDGPFGTKQNKKVSKSRMYFLVFFLLNTETKKRSTKQEKKTQGSVL